MGLKLLETKSKTGVLHLHLHWPSSSSWKRKRGREKISGFGIRAEPYAVIHARDLGGLGFTVATLVGKILEDGFDLQLRINAI